MKVKVSIELDEQLVADCRELGRMLKFDFEKLVGSTAEDALRNKIDGLRDEFKDP